MNNSLKEYPGFSFELNIGLNQLLVHFNERIYIQNISAKATWWSPSGHQVVVKTWIYNSFSILRYVFGVWDTKTKRDL